LAKEEMKFDEVNKLWVYKVSSNGATVYGRGETKNCAKKDYEKNCEDLWG